jgi:inorganic pyrophosphatase
MSTSPGPAALVDVVVEIPRGSRTKYEYDEQRGVIPAAARRHRLPR